MNIAACKKKRVVLLTHVNSTITKEEVLPNNFIFSIHIKHHLFCLLILTTNLTLPPLSIKFLGALSFVLETIAYDTISFFLIRLCST